MTTREAKRQATRQYRKNVMDSASILVRDYCIESRLSENNFENIKNLNKKTIKKISRQIETFIDNILKMAEMELETFDFKLFCPGEEPREFCHMEKEETIEGRNGRKRTRTTCLLYTSPSPRDATLSRMPSSA